MGEGTSSGELKDDNEVISLTKSIRGLDQKFVFELCSS